MRNGLTDKSLPVQRGAAQVMITVYTDPDAPQPTLGEVEQILQISAKNLENADQITRQAHAQLVGHVLSLTQVERAVPVPEAVQKAKKDQGLDEDEPGAAAHSAAETMKALSTPAEMFLQLSNQLNRHHLSRKTRIGIFDFYAALFSKLSPTWVENNFSLVISHLLTEVVMYPRNGVNRYETLITRKLVSILLRDLIGVRMLSEQGQISAIQELANLYLKRWPAMMPGKVAPASAVLVIALREVAGLLQQLGNAPPPVQVSLSQNKPSTYLNSTLGCFGRTSHHPAFPS